jgi:uncharacterized protein YjbI with pentapeptide repeats
MVQNIMTINTIDMKIKNGLKYEKNGWTYISIKGNPKDRGFAHGYLLANEIQRAIKTMKFSLYDEHGLDMEFFILLSNYIFKNTIEREYPEIFEELNGIVAGSNKKGIKLHIDELILWNNYAAIGYALPKVNEFLDKMPHLKDKYNKLMKHVSVTGQLEGGAKDRCSAFMAVGNYTADGKICCAHNSFDNYIDGQEFYCIIDIKPDKGNRILYQAAPGYISSQTDFFVTSNGFIGTETTIGGFHMYEHRHPITCRIRTCMQYAKTLDDYVKILKNNNSGDYANSWLIADTKRNEIMRIELGLNFVNVEKKKNGYFIGFNAPYDSQIRNLECSNSGFDDIRRHQGARKVRLEQLMEQYKGKLDVDVAREIIADHYDVYLNKINMSSRTCCSHYDLDDRAYMSQADRPLPYQPRGAVDGVVCDTNMAKQMSIYARWGASCGTAFDVKDFVSRNAQWKRYEKYLRDRPSQPWTVFKSEDKILHNKKNMTGGSSSSFIEQVNELDELDEVDKHIHNHEFIEEYIQNKDIDNVTINNVIFNSSIFENTTFQDCMLYRNTFSNGTELINVEFNNSVISKTDFIMCKLQNVKFTVSSESENNNNNKFYNCIIEFCNFNKINLTNSIFKNCLLSDSDFSETNLTNVVFEKCDFTGVIFNDNTNIEGAEFNNITNLDNSRIPEEIRIRIRSQNIQIIGENNNNDDDRLSEVSSVDSIDTDYNISNENLDFDTTAPLFEHIRSVQQLPDGDNSNNNNDVSTDYNEFGHDDRWSEVSSTDYQISNENLDFDTTAPLINNDESPENDESFNGPQHLLTRENVNITKYQTLPLFSNLSAYDTITMEEINYCEYIEASSNNLLFIYNDQVSFIDKLRLQNMIQGNNIDENKIVFKCKKLDEAFIPRQTNIDGGPQLNMDIFGIFGIMIPLAELDYVVNNQYQIYVIQTNNDSNPVPIASLNTRLGGNVVSANHCQALVSIKSGYINYVENDYLFNICNTQDGGKQKSKRKTKKQIKRKAKIQTKRRSKKHTKHISKKQVKRKAKIQTKRRSKNTKNTKCIGKRDGKKGCRTCCNPEKTTKKYNKCIDTCMTGY